MKRILPSGVAIAACFGLATSALAQSGTNYNYSSYGYHYQEAQQQDVEPSASPSDQQPMVAQEKQDQAPQAQTRQGQAGCDAGCDSVQHYLRPARPVAGNCGCATAGCDGNCGAVGGNLIRSNDRNIVVGVRGLYFERDYEDDRGLGSNSLGEYLFTTDADHDFIDGFEASIGVRNCSGSGWEATYWGLFREEADVVFDSGNQLYSSVTGLSAVQLSGSSVLDRMNAASNWRLYRNTEIHNVELNLLRNAGTTCGLLGGTANLEWFAGTRWFKFSEDLRWVGGGPATAFTVYDMDTENNLLGFQLGANVERCVNSRTTITLGSKFGVYSNEIDTSQRIVDEGGTFATIPGAGGVDYNFAASKDEVATLGELDLGLNYQFNECWRGNVGYRLIGVTSVALAADQIPINFNDTQEITRVKSNGSLLLHGVYFGVERSY